MKSNLSNLSYLGYYSLKSNLNNTKLVEGSDWTNGSFQVNYFHLKNGYLWGKLFSCSVFCLFVILLYYSNDKNAKKNCSSLFFQLGEKLVHLWKNIINKWKTSELFQGCLICATKKIWIEKDSLLWANCVGHSDTFGFWQYLPNLAKHLW